MVSFDATVSQLSKSKTMCLIAGDYNIDILKSVVHSGTEQFVNNLYSSLFVSSILRATRFRSSNSTLIDHIFGINKPHDV